MNILFEEWIERLPTVDNIHRRSGDRLSDELEYSSTIPYSDKHEYYKELQTDNITKYTKEYTRNASGALNKALYDLANTGHEKMFLPSYHEMEHGINNDIHKAPSPSEDLYVYSGVKELIPSRLTNRYVHVPQFMSTSLLPHVAKEFAQLYSKQGNTLDNAHYSQHVLRIRIPAYSNHGLYLANHSHYPKEEEFLLRNNNVLHIADTPHSYTQQFPNGNLKTIHLWDAHIITPAEHHLLLDNEAIQEKLRFEDKLRKPR